MLITCPECLNQISSYAIACPHCGFPIPQEKKTEKPKTVNVKKKKHSKLPNGFGSIKKITGNKERYGVYPPTKKEEFNENGVPPTKKALCYVVDWYLGFYALLDYKNGVFDSEKYKLTDVKSSNNDESVVNKIIESYNRQNRINKNKLTFAEIYDLYYNDKYVNSKKVYSDSSIRSTKSAYANVKSLHDKIFEALVTKDLQEALDSCPLKHSSLELIKVLFNGMYAYAIKNNIVDKDYAHYVQINISDDDESGEPFTEDELDILWNDKDDPVTQKILIMIYSGFRIKAFESIKINFEEQYFLGGVKTKAGKERIVPIHPLIKEYVQVDTYYKFKAPNFRNKFFYPKLDQLGIANTADGKKHTPHDCRHTFSWLADKYKIDDVSKHMLMGHSLGNDVEKSKYTHRTLEELRSAIEQIQKK